MMQACPHCQGQKAGLCFVDGVKDGKHCGWRIIRDWLEAQLAIIETEMVTFDQGTTLYQLVAENRLQLPASEEVQG